MESKHESERVQVASSRDIASEYPSKVIDINNLSKEDQRLAELGYSQVCTLRPMSRHLLLHADCTSPL
jgi:hypothetical protein